MTPIPSLAFVLPLLLGGADHPTAWSFDFDSGVPRELRLQGAKLTADRRIKLEGSASLLADFRGDDGAWHEFLHTGEEIRFDRGGLYAVSFDYRVVDAEDARVEFYSQLRSRAGKGDLQGDHWIWTMPTGTEGTIHRLFPVVEDGGYYLMLGVRHGGAIAIDNLEIRATAPNLAARQVPVRTHKSPLDALRKRFDRQFERNDFQQLLGDMLIIALDEGAGQKARARKDEIARDLQLDFVDWNVFGELAVPYGVRSSSGGCEYQEYYRREGTGSAAEREAVWANRYRHFGEKGFVRSLENTFVHDSSWGEGGYFTCHNGIGWHSYYLRTLLETTGRHAAITQDNIACSTFNRVRGCYCPGCKSKFQSMLAARFTPAEFQLMKIGNPASFDIQAYIVRHGLLGDAAVADPVVREFMKFQHLSGLQAWADCTERAKAAAARQRRALPVGGNQINAWGTWPYAVALSQFVDFVEIEELVSAKGEIPRRTLQYKVGLASGHHQKPVWVRGPVEDGTGDKKPMLSRAWWTVHFAEALANGGIREFSLGINRPWTGEPGTMDYLDDPALYRLYVDFAAWMREHRSLLTHRDSQARVAVVYSLPALMFRRYDALHTSDGGRLGRFEAVTRLLERQHVPYDVLIFGHPELWDDGPAFERLKQYGTVVLPGIDALTDDQAEELRKFARKGGVILADGPVPFEENLTPRPAPADIPWLAATDDNISIQGTAASLVAVDAPEQVLVNIWRSCAGRSLDVHLLNYDADVAADRLNTLRDVRLRVLVPPDLNVTRCVLSRFGQKDRSIDIRRSGASLEVTVPELEAYAIVSFTDDASIEATRIAAEQRRTLDREMVRRMASELKLY